MRTEYDLEMLKEIGFCNGIENYSRHLSARKPGQRPWCLIDFFRMISFFLWMKVMSLYPKLEECFTGIYLGKVNWSILVFDYRPHWNNRPLKPDEFDDVTGQTIYVSATRPL